MEVTRPFYIYSVQATSSIPKVNRHIEEITWEQWLEDAGSIQFKSLNNKISPSYTLKTGCRSSVPGLPELKGSECNRRSKRAGNFRNFSSRVFDSAAQQPRLLWSWEHMQPTSLWGKYACPLLIPAIFDAQRKLWRAFKNSFVLLSVDVRVSDGPYITQLG